MAWLWCQRGSVTAFMGAEYQAALSTKGYEKGHTHPGLHVQFLFLFLPSHKRPIMVPHPSGLIQPLTLQGPHLEAPQMD